MTEKQEAKVLSDILFTRGCTHDDWVHMIFSTNMFPFDVLDLYMSDDAPVKNVKTRRK
jgi:hypothetical protein